MSKEQLIKAAPDEFAAYERARAALKYEASDAWAVYVEAADLKCAAPSEYEAEAQRVYNAAEQVIESEAVVKWAAYLTAKLALKMAAPDEWEAYAADEAEYQKARAALIKAAPEKWTAYKKARAALIAAKKAYEKAVKAVREEGMHGNEAALQAANAKLKAAQAVDKKARAALEAEAPDEWAAYEKAVKAWSPNKWAAHEKARTEESDE